MKRLVLALFVTLAAMLTARAGSPTFPDETLHYVITYKWGLLTKDTGDATLTLRRNSDIYNILLTGRTRNWADKLYKVRDTLRATVDVKDFRPRSYTKIANEGGDYAIDNIVYAYADGQVLGTCDKFKRKKDGTEKQDVKKLSSTGPTYDMLSVFYYLRLLPFADIKSHQVVKLTMFSGTAAEQVTITPVGLETITLRNKQKAETWHIRFRFTTGGGKKSSDDIDAWISNDDRRIPLLLVGSLPLGKITCYYTG